MAPGAAAEHEAVHHHRDGHATFQMGGLVHPKQKFRRQRLDQGQDLEVPIGEMIHAPGPGVVIGHGADRAWPSGFGNPYAIIRITHGPFAVEDGEWYVGHCDDPAHVPPIGHRFAFGDPIGKTVHGLYSGWGWCEFGKAGQGGYASTNGVKFAHLFVPIVRKWPR